MTNATVHSALAAVSTNAVDASAAVATNLSAKNVFVATNNLDEPAAVATNATVAVAPPPPERPESAGSSWTLPVLVVVIVGAVLAALRKKPSSPAHVDGPVPPRSSDPRGTIEDDVLAAVAPNAPNRGALRSELAAALAGSGKLSAPSLAPILRIEESFEKTKGSKYLRRVSILRRKDGTTGTLSKVESEIGWEYVPDAVRGEFIRTRGEKIVRLVYDAGKADRE